MSIRSCATAVLAVALVSAPARAADVPAALKLLPADAVGFVHVRVADVYEHEMMKGLRDTIAAAGPKAVAAFEKQVYPTPASVESVTVFVMMTHGGPQPVGVVAFKDAVDAAKILKLHMPNARAETMRGKAVAVDYDTDIAVLFVDGKHAVISSTAGLTAFVAAKPGESKLAAAVGMTSKKAIVAAVNVSAIPVSKRELSQIPAEFQPLLKADRVTLTLDLSAADPVLEARVSYPRESAAAEAKVAIGEAVKLGKQQIADARKQFEAAQYGKQDAGPRPFADAGELAMAVIALGAINQAEPLLNDPPVKKDGTDLTASVTVPKSVTGLFGLSGASLGLLLPAVQKVREAAGRSQGQNNLKQIALCFHNHDSANGHCPGNIYSADGKPLLSWRVAILPYLDQDDLYKRFKLDEPWDSEHNKKLLPLMPKQYMVSNARISEAGKTYYQGFAGKKGVSVRPFFVDDPKLRTRLSAIPDGTSNTILVAEAATAVEWTKPEDIAFDPDKNLPKLGGHTAGGFYVVMCDSSGKFIRDTIDPKTLKAMVTTNGAEVIME